MEIDYITGVSFGALTGAAIALDWDVALTKKLCQQNFTPKNILRDYQIPFISISAGKHVDVALQRELHSNIEDMWLPFICHSCNISNSSLCLHTEGDVFSAVRASVAIPGVLPPKVIGDNYLVDGGLINNLPVDILYQMGCARSIGVDVGSANERYADTPDQVAPSAWTILKNKLIGKKKNSLLL